MIFEPCHSPAFDALSFIVAVDLLVSLILLSCAMAGAAIRAEPSTAAARNLESIFILLKGCLTRNQLAGWRKGPDRGGANAPSRSRRRSAGRRYEESHRAKAAAYFRP